jgi:hypothetical protein
MMMLEPRYCVSVIDITCVSAAGLMHMQMSGPGTSARQVATALDLIGDASD